MSIQNKYRAAIAGLLLLGACADLAIGEELPEGVDAHSQALSAQQGLPVPAKRAPSGEIKLSWDGQYADLLAADAFAVCWLTLSGKTARGGYQFGTDSYLGSLWSKMSAAACVTTSTAANPDHAVFQRWVDSRKDPACNADLDTSTFRGVDLLNGVTRQTATYVLPPAASLGVTGTQAAAGMARAQQFLDATEISLCMAQRMRERFETPQIAFAPDSQAELLQSLVQDRALIATNYFTELLKILSAPDTGARAIGHANWFAPVLAAWRTNLDRRGLLASIGRDFALATEILISNTEEYASGFLRRPDAQARFGLPYTALDGATRLGALAGPRVDLFKLLYGRKAFKMPVESVGAPQVQTALQLARRLPGGIPLLEAETRTPDLQNTATALQLSIEAQLRADECRTMNTDLARWMFNESSGATAADGAGGDRPGQLMDGASWRAGRSGNAVLLDGLNDRIQVPNSTPFRYQGGDMTLSAWIFPDPGDTDGGSLFSKPFNGSGGYNYYVTYTAAGAVSIRLMNQGLGPQTYALSTPNGALGSGAWHQVAVSLGADRSVQLFVDGALAASGSHSITDWEPTTYDLNDMPLVLGYVYPYAAGIGSNTVYGFKGMIDDARVHGRALQAEEAAAMFAAPGAMSTPNVTVCSTPASAAPYADYLLSQRYGVQQEHVLQLVRGLYELVAGPPYKRIDDTRVQFTYSPLIENGNSEESSTLFHVLGQHSTSGGAAVLDAGFSVVPFSAAEIQGYARPSMPPYLSSLTVNPRPFHSDLWEPVDDFAAVPTLVMAREALAQTRLAVPNLFSGAAAALPMVSDAIGSRTVAVRPEFESVPDATCAGCMKYQVKHNGGEAVWRVDIITNSADPVSEVLVANLANASTVGHFAGTRTFGGETQSALDGLPRLALQTVDLGGGLVRKTQSIAMTGWRPVLLLRTGRGAAAAVYDVVKNMAEASYETLPRDADGGAVAFGGRLNGIAARALEFSDKDWSKPKYDGLGLPLDWVPATDAASAAGEPPSAYYLRLARQAATEASDALGTAFQSIALDASDSIALAQSEEKGKALLGFEKASVCGANTECVPDFVLASPLVPACPNTPRLGEQGFWSAPFTDPVWCNYARDQISALAPPNGFPMASPVFAARSEAAPTFLAYKGGELQQLFVNQWAGWRALRDSLRTTLEVATAGAYAVKAAALEDVASASELAAIDKQLDDEWVLLSAQSQAAVAQRKAYNAAKSDQAAQLKTLFDEKEFACGDRAMQTAIASAFNYSDVASGFQCVSTAKGDVLTYDCPSYWFGFGFTAPNTTGHSSRSFSWGPLMAAQDRCRAAKTAYYNKVESTAELEAVMTAQAAAADALALALRGQKLTLSAKRKAAQDRRSTASARLDLAKQEAGIAIASQLSQATAAQATLLASIVAIDGAYARLNNARARITLGAAQESLDIRARFGVRRRYHSYDLWRAKALNENARRVAVAARRAIESRYVVQLSEMNTDEPFVEAPANWADSVYDTDLRPFAIGLVGAPSSGDGISANKVLDYVRNLELFVSGYSVERPTAQVRMDSEVISLPGPAALNQSDDGRFSVDAHSTGWRFLCPKLGRLLEHPQLASVNSDEATFDIRTACAGEAPTEARLNFYLDPWGGLNGSIVQPTYEDRHNVRWQQLAVNLVGSGIRDCREARDPSSCYQEPFLRFDLQHIGPALVTSYGQEWRALGIPVGVVEGGKALAAEEWLDPVTAGWNLPVVANIARMELAGRPMGGSYELVIELTPDVRVEAIERVQVLVQHEYWVRQHQR